MNGSGTLVLLGQNSYSGQTQIVQGTLRAVGGVGLPTTSNLNLAGGIYESNGSFIRPLGVGVNQVQWTSAGGFSAQGGVFNIELGGSTTSVTWGAGGFVPSGQALFFNTLTSDNLVNFANGISLANAYQTVIVFDNPNSTTDLAQISGIISSNGGLIKNGAGTLILTGQNSYTLATEIVNGILRAVDGKGLPTKSNLILDGGVFETTGTFNRALGSGSDQVQWLSSGGFSAQGGPLTVNLGGSTATVVWGSPSFLPSGVPLVLNSLTADSLLNFQNGIDLGGQLQEIIVVDNPNSSTDLAEMTGVLSDGGIVKGGTGTLIFTNHNTYALQTIITTGTLRALDGTGLPLASNLVLEGGIFESNGTFTRALGTGTAASQVQWQSSGGFSAQGAALNIRLNNSTTAVTWGSGGFVPAGDTLLFNALTSDNLVNFENGINLAAGLHTVEVTDNPNSTADLAQISGVVGNGGLQKTGTGTLLLSAVNTYAGGTQIASGTVRITFDTSLGAVPVSGTTTSNIVFTGGGATTSSGAPINSGTLQFATNFAGTFSPNRLIEVDPGVTATIDTDGLSITGAGKLMLDANGSGSATLIKADGTGAGVFESDVAPSLGANSSLQVSGGTLRFKLATVAPASSVGTGVTATIAAGATLELAGFFSTLGISGGTSSMSSTTASRKTRGDYSSPAGTRCWEPSRESAARWWGRRLRPAA